MTWRRLFLWLLMASSVVFMATWGWSLLYGNTIHVDRKELGLERGSLVIRYQEFRDGTPGLSGHLGRSGVRQQRYGFPPTELGLWSWKYGWHHSKTTVTTSPTPGAAPVVVAECRWYIHTRQVPLWFPWVVFNTCSFAACWWMQRRSRSRMERTLAEGVAADRLTAE